MFSKTDYMKIREDVFDQALALLLRRELLLGGKPVYITPEVFCEYMSNAFLSITKTETRESCSQLVRDYVTAAQQNSLDEYLHIDDEQLDNPEFLQKMAIKSLIFCYFLDLSVKTFTLSESAFMLSRDCMAIFVNSTAAYKKFAANIPDDLRQQVEVTIANITYKMNEIAPGTLIPAHTFAAPAMVQ